MFDPPSDFWYSAKVGITMPRDDSARIRTRLSRKNISQKLDDREDTGGDTGPRGMGEATASTGSMLTSNVPSPVSVDNNGSSSVRCLSCCSLSRVSSENASASVSIIRDCEENDEAGVIATADMGNEENKQRKKERK